MNISALVQKIQTRSRECAFIGVVDAARVQNKNLDLTLVHNANKPFLDSQAAKSGFTEIVANPLTLEVLTRLVETYLANSCDDSD